MLINFTPHVLHNKRKVETYFLFLNFLIFLILKSLILTCIPKHEPPPTSFPITSLWVITMHQPRACCILRQTQNGILTCILSCKNRIASLCLMQDTACLGLVHGDDPERCYGDGGGSGVHVWERIYTRAGFMSMYGKTYTVL